MPEALSLLAGWHKLPDDLPPAVGKIFESPLLLADLDDDRDRNVGPPRVGGPVRVTHGNELHPVSQARTVSGRTLDHIGDQFGPLRRFYRKAGVEERILHLAEAKPLHAFFFREHWDPLSPNYVALELGLGIDPVAFCKIEECPPGYLLVSLPGKAVKLTDELRHAALRPLSPDLRVPVASDEGTPVVRESFVPAVEASLLSRRDELLERLRAMGIVGDIDDVPVEQLDVLLGSEKSGFE